MPSTYKALQEKFMDIDEHGVYQSDGIARATEILKKAGYTVTDDGYITVPDKVSVEFNTYGDVVDAQDFLMEEWDYSLDSFEFGGIEIRYKKDNFFQTERGCKRG